MEALHGLELTVVELVADTPGLESRILRIAKSIDDTASLTRGRSRIVVTVDVVDAELAQLQVLGLVVIVCVFLEHDHARCHSHEAIDPFRVVILVVSHSVEHLGRTL